MQGLENRLLGSFRGFGEPRCFTKPVKGFPGPSGLHLGGVFARRLHTQPYTGRAGCLQLAPEPLRAGLWSEGLAGSASGSPLRPLGTPRLSSPHATRVPSCSPTRKATSRVSHVTVLGPASRVAAHGVMGGGSFGRSFLFLVKLPVFLLSSGNHRTHPIIYVKYMLIFLQPCNFFKKRRGDSSF